MPPPFEPATRRRLIADLAALALIVAAVFAARTWVLTIAMVHTPTMLPTLLPGDVLLIERWPFALRHAAPARGDIVIVRGADGREEALRIAGLPGDRIGLRAGRLVIDGKPAPRWRVADAIVPIDAASPCPALRRASIGCRYPRFREMLPGGGMIDSIGPDEAPDIAPTAVPPSALFVVSDDRSRAAGARVMPTRAVVGRASMILLSLDGSARLARWRGWWRSVRRDRIAARF